MRTIDKPIAIEIARDSRWTSVVGNRQFRANGGVWTLSTPEPPDRPGQILFTNHDPAKVSRGIDDPRLDVLREPQFDDQVVANTVD